MNALRLVLEGLALALRVVPRGIHLLACFDGGRLSTRWKSSKKQRGLAAQFVLLLSPQEKH
jgi:hypothetical protein